jgi:hypothetical protein
MSPVEGEAVKARVPKVAEGKSAEGKAANLPPPRLCVCGAGNAGAAIAAYLKQVCEEDILFAYIPMVLLAEQLGLRMPVTRSMVEIFAAMLGESYWERGITPQQLGIEGLDTEELLAYIMEGSS